MGSPGPDLGIVFHIFGVLIYSILHFSFLCNVPHRISDSISEWLVNQSTGWPVLKWKRLKRSNFKKLILVCLWTRCKLHRWRWRWLLPDPARRAGSFVGKRPLEHRLGRSVGRAPAFNHKITLLAEPWHLTSDSEDLLGNLRSWFLWKSFGFCEVVAFWKQHFSAI